MTKNIDGRYELDTNDFKLLTDVMLDLKTSIHKLDDKITLIIEDNHDIKTRLALVETNCRRRENISNDHNNKLMALELASNKSLTRLDSTWTVVKIVAAGAITVIMTLLALSQHFRR